MSEYFRKPIVKTLMLKGQEGQSIKGIEKTGTDVLVDTYTITLTDGTTATFTVTNGKGISSLEKTGTSGLVDTYTITFNDGTNSTFTVKNGKEILSIDKTGTDVLVDTYTIEFNDGTTATFTVTNGKGISNISKTETSGLVDTYTIEFNDGTTSTFTVTNGDSAYKPAVEALGKRIDNLILSSGTESSAEVVDARNGYDGTTYDTLGTAIRSQVSELKSDLVNQTEYNSLLENEYCKTLGIHKCTITNGDIFVEKTDNTKLDFLMLPNVKELTFKIPTNTARYVVIATKLEENKYYCLHLSGYGLSGNLDSIASWTPNRVRTGYKANPLKDFRPAEDGFYKIVLAGNDINVYFNNEFLTTINEPILTKSLGFMLNDNIVVLSSSAIVPLNKVVEHTNKRIDNITPPEPTEVDLVMFMGQSNMAGRGVVDEAPYCVDDIGYEFKSVSDPTKLYKVSEPFGYAENSTYINDGNAKSGSLVSSFMREYFRITGRKIVGVSASVGATRIQFWSSNQNVINEYTERFNTAKTWLENNGYTIKHKFCVFCQGESNGDDGMEGTQYKTLLNDFCQHRMSGDLGMEKTFIISIGQYNGDDEILMNAYNNIQNAQREYCEASNYATLVSTMFKGMKDRNLMKDLYHYKQQGYNEVGEEAGYNVGIIMK